MSRDVPHFRMGMMLTEAGVLQPAQLHAAIQSGQQTGTPFLRILLDQQLITQHELQAVVKAQSLVFKGTIDVDTAVKALQVVHADGVELRQGLSKFGVLIPEDPPVRVITQPVQSGTTAGVAGTMNNTIHRERLDSTRPAVEVEPCSFCGNRMMPAQERCSVCLAEAPRAVTFREIKSTTRRPTSMAQMDTGRISPATPPRDPILMFFFSACCFPGLGQLLLGQAFKAIFVLAVTAIAGFWTNGATSLFIFPIAGLDAYLLADKLKNERSVGQWEWF